jgi:hypothetical protein
LRRWWWGSDRGLTKIQVENQERAFRFLHSFVERVFLITCGGAMLAPRKGGGFWLGILDFFYLL